MQALTGRGLISAALERLGAKDPQVDLSAEDGAQALGVLRRMVGLWNTRVLLPRVRSGIAISIVNGTGYGTIGDAAHSPDVTGDRLRFLESAFIVLPTEPTRQIPLSILTPEQWQALPIESGTPRSIYIEPTVPVTTIDLQPVPTGLTLTLNLYFKAMIPQITDLVTEFYFDEGYEAALVSNLAVWCAGPFRYNVNEDPMLVSEAADTRAAIQSLNEGPTVMQADPTGIFDEADSGFLLNGGDY